jgi:pSer/pThr/pTyr-binding forkhead associated (FHA) protein
MLRPLTQSPPVHIRYTDEHNNERTLTLAHEKLVIGREAGCQFRPRDPLVSRRHAELFWEGDTLFVRDLNSRNGTLLNDERVYFPTPLQDGDRINVGQHKLTIHFDNSQTHLDQGASDNEISSWLMPEPGDDAPAPNKDPRPSETHIKR